MSFEFDPPDGYENTTSFPTKPANETAFRASMQSLLNQLRDEINTGDNSAGGLTSFSRNAIINRNFDIWQRGTSFTSPINGSYTADRFRVNFAADGGTLPTAIHSRQSLTPGEVDDSFYYYRLNVNGAGASLGSASFYQITQSIEYGTRYLCGNNKKVTVSFYARSSITNKKIGIAGQQFYGTGGSPSATEILTGSVLSLTSSWQKFTITLTTNTLSGKTFGTNNDDYLRIDLWPVWGSSFSTRFGAGAAETFVGSGNIDIAQLQVSSGDSALRFQPISFSEELGMCQRYFEKSYDYSVAPGTASGLGQVGFGALSGVQQQFHVRFCSKKRVPPIVLTFDPVAGGSGGSGTSGKYYVAATGSQTDGNINNIGDSGFSILTPSTAAQGRIFHFTAEAEI